ncbi:protein ARV1 isoform X1 [Copidosoma floridanum]|uniref:protein ARV1 isoform X1 n=1 Tax=Copidosoma floridanum TaxID=29053 RepID=UPI0006C9A798|nr:protein ARV1 isoform X1 [Copidosoma floridanum]XP_014204171.1 protein ARV1 isoform X1 [Copidosoma floridanum]
MYTCINCGAHVDKLYRRYSPSVLKIVKCENCGKFADKYVEYDPVIVLVDLVLLEKPAYRHLLYNNDFNAYWKLLIVLILGESFRQWTNREEQLKASGLIPSPSSPLLLSSVNHRPEYKFEFRNETMDLVGFQSERDFYFLLGHTALALGGFACAVLFFTELRWRVFGGRPSSYEPKHLVRALVIGGCAKLLDLLSIVWHHVDPEPHGFLIYGYTVLCLLTAYSVVCESGRASSLIALTVGLWVHNYVYKILGQYLPTTNVTLLQT